MTTRTVIIKSSEEKGQSLDGGLFGDTSPDREEYVIEGVNCTPREFIDWFLIMPEGQDFCSSGNDLIDIGGSSLDLSVGARLSVCFEEYFTAWLKRQTDWALNQIRIDSINAYDNLNIIHWQGEPLCLMSPKERLDIAFHMNRFDKLSNNQLNEYIRENQQMEDQKVGLINTKSEDDLMDLLDEFPATHTTKENLSYGVT